MVGHFVYAAAKLTDRIIKPVTRLAPCSMVKHEIKNMDERIEVLESRIGELEKQFTKMNNVNCCTKSEDSVDAIFQNALDLTHVKNATSNFKTNCKVTYQRV
ncbi:MAG TPA: ABC transporter C-terminal domain-containing protein [Arsenophonus apicola]